MKNSQWFIKAGTAARRLQRKAPTADGRGFTTVDYGGESFTYDVYLDEDLLVYLAHKAARSKRGVSRDGALEVRITKRVRS
jgi:hypothetical protein